MRLKPWQYSDPQNKSSALVYKYKHPGTVRGFFYQGFIIMLRESILHNSTWDPLGAARCFVLPQRVVLESSGSLPEKRANVFW